MKTLTVRGVPEEVCERLKERARAHRRSLNQEIVCLLEASASAEQPSEVTATEEILAVRELRQRWLKEPISPEEAEGAAREGRT